MKKIGLFISCLACVFLLQAQVNDLRIVFIGNSITQGAQLADVKKEAPPVRAVEWLSRQPDSLKVSFANKGVSGKTTVDFLPVTNTFFPKVTQAATELIQEKGGTLLFSIMLGTNDSAIKGPHGAPVSGVQYYTNMKAIIDELLRLFPQCLVVLQRPTWYSPNTYNTSMYLKEGLNRLTGYQQQLEALVAAYKETNPGKVFMGDTDAYDYFKENWKTDLKPEEGNAGTFYLHPNAKGAIVLGEYWGKAIYRVMTKNR